MLDMIRIKPLTRLEADDIRSLNTGYTSLAVYRVGKDESPQRTLFSLELAELQHPFVKHWETDDEELAMLQGVAGQGYSLGAYHDQLLVGIALAEPRRWNRSLWVWEFHVLPGYKRSGLGTCLMQNLVQLARQAGLRALVVETQSTNLPAINFYRKNGFEIDGIDLSYYTNDDLVNGEVALFMKYKLGDG